MSGRKIGRLAGHAVAALLSVGGGALPEGVAVTKLWQKPEVEPRPTGNPTPASIERHQRRAAHNRYLTYTGGIHNIGKSTRGAVLHEPQDIETRQSRQLADRKVGIEKPRHPHCRKYGPRGLRAAKQFAERAGIDIS